MRPDQRVCEGCGLVGHEDELSESEISGDLLCERCSENEPVKLTHDELLVLLIEECSEVIQAATKCLRFGFDVDHGTGYGNNAQMLAKEMGELTAVRDALDLEDSKIMRDAFMDGWAYKIERAETAKAKFGRAALASQGDRE